MHPSLAEYGSQSMEQKVMKDRTNQAYLTSLMKGYCLKCTKLVAFIKGTQAYLQSKYLETNIHINLMSSRNPNDANPQNLKFL